MTDMKDWKCLGDAVDETIAALPKMPGTVEHTDLYQAFWTVAEWNAARAFRRGYEQALRHMDANLTALAARHNGVMVTDGEINRPVDAGSAPLADVYRGAAVPLDLRVGSSGSTAPHAPHRRVGASSALGAPYGGSPEREEGTDAAADRLCERGDSGDDA